MVWLKGLTLAALSIGAWQSWKALDAPVIRGGKRWYRQPDGRYRRWYGGRALSESELREQGDAPQANGPDR